MTLLDLSDQKLIRLERDGEFLLAYPESADPKKFSLVGISCLNCSINRLTSLPLLSEGLEELICSFNHLTSLPPLPKGVKALHCSWNRLTSLPLLPETLETLDCHNNCLAGLLSLPKSLVSLNCSYNHLTELFLPEALDTLYCYKNPLKYVPFFRERPEVFLIPDHLKKIHSEEHYQEGYRIQEFSRYLFLTLFTELGLQLDFVV